MTRNAPSFTFFRAYGAIVLGIVLVALLLDQLLLSFAADDQEQALVQQYTPVFRLLQRELDGLAPDAIGPHVAFDIGDIGIPVTVVSLDDFAIADDLQAAKGAVHVFYDSDGAPMLYQRIAGTRQLLALGPLPQDLQAGWLDVFVISAYYALVALILLLWIRPFYRDLSRLRGAAAELGKEDFATRVQLGEKSHIYPVAQSFNAMADRIEYLVSAHRELTNAVSHELRTPLARFKFSLEILARSTDADKRQQYLDNMKADVSELEQLIDEMLSYARLSEQNLLMKLVDMDLRQWLQQELTAYANEPIRVACSFAVQPSTGDYRASFNPELMARALHNVVRNGLRYARSIINVHAQLNGTSITIRICDDGPGIPPAMHEKIFEPFSRLETSRDKASGGYGLGLAIAARILQRHQGRVSVANCEPNGTCFTLGWPRHARTGKAG
ncbi:MAG TPA: ATP-binding protein [Pseudomonadales bacterium]